MSDVRKKGVDEKFCKSCGEIIKLAAEICPKCGVRQKEATVILSTIDKNEEARQKNWAKIKQMGKVYSSIYIIVSIICGGGIIIGFFGMGRYEVFGRLFWISFIVLLLFAVGMLIIANIASFLRKIRKR